VTRLSTLVAPVPEKNTEWEMVIGYSWTTPSARMADPSSHAMPNEMLLVVISGPAQVPRKSDPSRRALQ
jgi:hypothetical protein